LTTGDIAVAAKLSEKGQALISEDLGPSRFVDLLEAQELFRDAIQFLAHGLPIRIAVKWGCTCSRELLPPDQIETAKASLEAAEGWLNSPADETRWIARNAAEESNMASPVDLIAMAAFFSGGSVAPPEAPMTPPPPYIANKLAAGGIELAVLSQAPEKSAERFRRTLQLSREIVKGER
jgi:uncharacterized protein DUF6931